MHSRFYILFRPFLVAVRYTFFCIHRRPQRSGVSCFAHSGVDVDMLWTRIRGLLLKALVCVQPAIRAHACAFELYGFDVMIDAATDSVAAAAVSSSHSHSSSSSSSASASSPVGSSDSNGLQSSSYGSTSGSASGTGGGGGVRPWLIECNASPSMECDAPIDWQVFCSQTRIAVSLVISLLRRIK
jgi:hypothetical protein